MYDVVIVGSGLGGLECGCILSKEGYKVCVLEKNRQFGGNLQIFSRDKAIFDTGIHYIGGLDEGQNLNQCFKFMGIRDSLKLRKMDEDAYDIISFNGDQNSYPHAQGYTNFKAQLQPYFPKEIKALEAYCTVMQQVCNSLPLYNLEPIKKLDLTYLEKSAKTFFDSITKSKTLKNVLAGTNPLYQGMENMTPLYVHAIVVNSYIQSAWKCEDGGAQIAALLANQIKSNGGTVRNYSEVKKMKIKNGEIAHVELETGEHIEGKSYISNIHPVQTFGLLKGDGIRKSYRRRIEGLTNSISAFMLHLVFKENAFPYMNYNHYHYSNPDVWAKYDQKKWPQSYYVFCPPSSKSSKFADCVSVMTYMSFDEVKKWQSTFNTTPKHVSYRGDEYEQFKSEKAEKLLDVMEEKYPNIRSKIKSYHTSSPLSYRDYIGTEDGSMYGIMKDYKHPLKSVIAPKTKIPNLFLTGQNINMHGVLGVTLTALSTCFEFLGEEYLLQKVNSA